MEIQDMMFSYNKDLRSVHNKLAAVQRNMRVQEVTANYLKDIPTTAPLYRALGKAYISTPRDEIDDRLAKESEINAKSQRDLVDRKEYLERRIASANQHLKDIASGF
jgi:prefoldin subunit 1